MSTPNTPWRTRFVALALCIAVSGCANTGENWAKTAGAVMGATLGVAAAKALAKYDQKRLKLSDAETKKRERGYMISFALVGGAAGSALGGTVYAKLKEEGRKEREAALLKAAEAARPQRYGEPTDEAVKGIITPGQRYADKGNQRECVDMEDALSDGKTADKIFVKYCRSVPNGQWAAATA